MKWLAILLTTTAVWAQEELSYRDIPVGQSPKEVEIACTTWFAGGFVHCDAVVVGEIQAVTSQVQQSASQVLPEETCVIKIDSMFGTTPELAAATMVKLHARYIHDTYQQLEPDWGVYRHLKRGQRVMALLHRYEGGPAIGSEALIVINSATEKLPEILRRTQLDPARFTDADLAVLKAANSRLHEDMMARVVYAREQHAVGDLTPLEWLALAGAALTLAMALIWIGSRVARRIRRR